MQIRYVKLPAPPRSPVARFLYGLVGILVLAAAALVGAVLFLALLGVFAIGTTGLALRSWWLRRNGGPRATRPGPGQGPHTTDSRAHAPAGSVLEGEYTVVDRR